MPRARPPRVTFSHHGRDRKRDRGLHEGTHTRVRRIGRSTRMTMDFGALQKQLDTNDMMGRIVAFPAQMEAAWKIGAEFAPRAETLRGKSFERVVVCGMGGSAIGGDLARSFLGERAKVPVLSCLSLIHISEPTRLLSI